MYSTPTQTREVNRILNEKERKPKKKTEAQLFHKMPDGTIMTGAKHSAYSKVVKKKIVQKKNKKKKSTYNKK
tara:strand:- start:54 stop:269 length:216 start_codon:yes stop_codon:yes gene_type:complete